MDPNELTGLLAAFLAALSFGSYGVPMKGEAATRVDVDPLVFQSYKAFTVLVTSAVLIWVNNMLADEDGSQAAPDTASYWSFQKWSCSDFTPWAFVSAILWVPGGTAGVYAIRRAGLAISVGIWSCVIVILSYMWGVLIFGEKQKSVWGSVGSVAVLCIGLCGISYFSSVEVEIKKKKKKKDIQGSKLGDRKTGEETALLEKGGACDIEEVEELDLVNFPHCGTNPHSHMTVAIHLPALFARSKEQRTIRISKYHIGLAMAVLNGVLAATIMVPLHYAPPNTTRGVGYSMSFGIAAVLVVIAFWILRYLFISLEIFVSSRPSSISGGEVCGAALTRDLMDSLMKGYHQMPSFHIRAMWKAGLTSGFLYSLGNLCGIVSIQRLGDFMGYSLNQSSMIVSGLWGLFYYREIPGSLNMIGFLASSCVVFAGILLMGSEHSG